MMDQILNVCHYLNGKVFTAQHYHINNDSDFRPPK